MKILKRSLLFVLILAILYVATIFILEFYIEKQLKKEKQLSYKEFKMSFTGNIVFKDLKFKNDLLDVQAEEIKLNVGFIKIITSDTILIEKATAKNVKLNYFKRDVDSTMIESSDVNKPKQKNKRSFALRKVVITGLDFYSMKDGDTLTRVLGIDLQANLKDIKDIKFNQLERLSFQSMRQKAGVLEDISADHFKYEDHTISIDSFKVFTPYSKKDYINHIPEQKCYVDMIAHNLILDSVDFDIKKNKLDKISVNEINVDSFDLDVYRDKTIPMYTQYDPTYGELVQKFDFKIDINAVIAKNSRVIFSMKTEDGRVSKIDMINMNGRLAHVNNIPSKKQKTTLKGTFSLGPGSLVALNLTYNQYAKVETFELDVRGTNIDAQYMNSMVRPANNIELNGSVKEIDAHMVSKKSANGTLRIQTNGLGVQVYKQNGEKNKFLTFVGNQVLYQQMDKKTEIEDFKRDTTRPIWNYIWHFILKGIKDAII